MTVLWQHWKRYLFSISFLPSLCPAKLNIATLLVFLIVRWLFVYAVFQARAAEVEGENERLKVVIKQKEEEIRDNKKVRACIVN